MERAGRPPVGSAGVDREIQAAPGGSRSRLRQRFAAKNKELNERTVALLEQAQDSSLSEPERQQRIDLVVQINLPIAEALARRYRSRGEELDDLIQVARVGLLQAVKRFRPEMGPFSAFAVPTITGEIKRYFRDRLWSTPRPPRRLQELCIDAKSAWSEIAQERGRIPTAADIADRLGANPERVREALAISPFTSVSLDEPAESPAAYEGLCTTDPEFQAVEDALERTQIMERVRSAVTDLPERDRLILRLHYGHNYTQSAIAAELGISQMTVSRHLATITRTLRLKICTTPIAR